MMRRRQWSALRSAKVERATYVLWQTDDGVDRAVVVQVAARRVVSRADDADVLSGDVRAAVQDGPSCGWCQVGNSGSAAILRMTQ